MSKKKVFLNRNWCISKIIIKKLTNFFQKMLFMREKNVPCIVWLHCEGHCHRLDAQQSRSEGVAARRPSGWRPLFAAHSLACVRHGVPVWSSDVCVSGVIWCSMKVCVWQSWCWRWHGVGAASAKSEIFAAAFVSARVVLARREMSYARICALPVFVV